MKRPSRAATVVAMAVCLLGCGGDATGPRGPGVIVERRVRPSETGPGIFGWNDEHIAWIGEGIVGRPSGLLVLLPGTNGEPGHALLVGREAARMGWRVIGLMYPDDVAVLAACQGDTACMSAMRDEIVRGEDRVPWVEVDAANSIDGRLAALLRWLHDGWPDEGWDAFLEGDAPRWNAIAISGLSQGGGHAAYIGTIRDVRRVIMFGAPADGADGEAVAWTQSSVTPAERWYGFAHARDPFTSIVPNWLALGLADFGGVTMVDALSAPYGGSHMLTTDRLPRTERYGHAHASVFADFATPLDDRGAPAFAPVWRYLFGEGGVE